MQALSHSAWILSVSLLGFAVCACSSAPPTKAAFGSAPPRVSTGVEGDDLSLAAELGSNAKPLDAPLTRAPLRQEPAPASKYPNMYRRMGLKAGAAFFSNFDTSVQVDGSGGAGAVLDMEDFLGLDEDNLVVRADAFYAFSPRHRIDVSVYDINRDGTRTIGEDIQVGQVVIPAGEVDSTLDTLIVKAAYRYNFVADERTAIGVSFGLHTMGIDLAIKSQDFAVSEGFRATAPLPVFGLHGEYALSERWKLLASTELFQIDLGFAQGFVGDNLLAVEHDLFDHFGWGLALNGFQLNAEFEDSPLTADLEYGYQGVLLYLRGYL
jgi:hypothetical protein